MRFLEVMKKASSALIYIFSLCLFLSSMSHSLYGQGYLSFRSEQRQIADRAKWRIGPFRIFPAIQFRNIGYDDNVYFNQEGDNPVSDYTGTISTQISVYLLFRDWLILSFSENPWYVYYVKEKRQRALNNSFSPGFRLLFLNRFVISGSYQYQRAKRRATREFDVPAFEEVKGYGGRIFYETARRTSFGFSGSISDISYEDTAQPGQETSFYRYLNREVKNGNFEFYYRIFSESSFFMSIGYTDYTFKNIESRGRNSYSYQVYSGIQFPLIGRMRGTLSLGYKKLQPRIRDRKGFSGLVGNTSLDFRTGLFGFRLQYKRDSRFSFRPGNTYFIENIYGSGISFYLTQFLRLDYYFSYGEGNYPEVTSLRMPDGSYKEIKWKDIYRTHSVGFVIRVIRNTGIGLTVNFFERDSNYYRARRNRMFIGGYITSNF